MSLFQIMAVLARSNISEIEKAIRGELHKEHLHLEVVGTHPHTGKPIRRWKKELEELHLIIPGYDQQLNAALKNLGCKLYLDEAETLRHGRKIFKWKIESAKIPQVAKIIEKTHPDLSVRLMGGEYEHHRNNHIAKEIELHDSMKSEADVLTDIPRGEEAHALGHDYLPFQKAGIEYIVRRDKTLLADAPRLGKTLQAIGACNMWKPEKVLIVCPKSVKLNWKREWKKWSTLTDLGSPYVVKGRSDTIPDHGIVIINYDILHLYKEQLDRAEFDVVIADECFPYDTKVITDQGPVPIGDIVKKGVGMYALSCDPRANILAWKRIVRRIAKRRQGDLVKVAHTNGSFVCTPNHKVFTEENGYVEAGTLGSGQSLWMVRKDFRVSIFGDSERYEDPRESAEYSCSYETQADCAGRERKTFTGASESAVSNLRECLGCGISDKDKASIAYVQEYPVELQGRSSERSEEDCCRNRRCELWFIEEERAGQKERFCFERTRVVSVEIYEQGSYAESVFCSDVCDNEQFVYNLEIEDNHNYFADGVLVSNCHAIKNGKTKRAKALVGYWDKKTQTDFKGVPAKKYIFMSGTPIDNKPDELWPLLRVLDPDGLARKYKRYIYKDYDGKTRLKNANELATELRSRIMVRRTKADVFKELPPRVEKVVVLEPDKKAEKALADDRAARKQYAEYIKEMEEIRGQYEEEVSQIPVVEDEEEESAETKKKKREVIKKYEVLAHNLHAKGGVPFDKIAEVRHRTAVAKLPQFIEYMEEVLDEEENDKIIVFGYHQDVIDGIKSALDSQGIGYVKIDGRDASEIKRQNSVDQFQTDPKIRVFIGQIRAAGEGITLSAGKRILFAEQDWTPGKMDQASDRAFNMASKEPVFVDNVVFDNTLDADMAHTIIEKQAMIRKVMEAKATPQRKTADVIKENAIQQQQSVKDVEVLESKSERKPDPDEAQSYARKFSEVFRGSVNTRGYLPDYSTNVPGNPDKQVKFLADIQRILKKIAWKSSDADFGKVLSSAAFLSPKMAAWGIAKIHQYRGSLPEEDLDAVGVEPMKRKPKEVVKVSEETKPHTEIKVGQKIRAFDEGGNLIMGTVESGDADSITVGGEKYSKAGLNDVREYVSPIHSDPEKKKAQLDAIQRGLRQVTEIDLSTDPLERGDHGFSSSTRRSGRYYAGSDLHGMGENDQVEAYRVLQIHQRQVDNETLREAGITPKGEKVAKPKSEKQAISSGMPAEEKAIWRKVLGSLGVPGKKHERIMEDGTPIQVSLYRKGSSDVLKPGGLAVNIDSPKGFETVEIKDSDIWSDPKFFTNGINNVETQERIMAAIHRVSSGTKESEKQITVTKAPKPVQESEELKVEDTKYREDHSNAKYAYKQIKRLLNRLLYLGGHLSAEDLADYALYRNRVNSWNEVAKAKGHKLPSVVSMDELRTRYKLPSVVSTDELRTQSGPKIEEKPAVVEEKSKVVEEKPIEIKVTKEVKAPKEPKEKKPRAHSNTSLWDLFDEDEVEKGIVLVSTARKSSERSLDLRKNNPRVGKPARTLLDLVKGDSEAVMESWARKMKIEGGEHPFTWCVKKAKKFADDPEGFCSAVHQKAFGKTPMERKIEKKG